MEPHVWRLIAHHEDSDLAIRRGRDASKIAIGWGKLGDLRRHSADVAALGAAIRASYPDLSNSSSGGPGLYRFVHQIRIGDLVIISDGSRRREVAQVTGDYEWSKAWTPVKGGDYWNHRAARYLSGASADELWRGCGAAAADGENIRWPVVRLHQRAPAKFLSRYRDV